jgi:hypothetical protein
MSVKYNLGCESRRIFAETIIIMKTTLLFASIAIAAGLILANIYTSIVDVRSWGSNIPESIGTARNYFKVANPGDFFRIFSPINQVLALLALILFWKAGPSIRLTLGAALLLYVATDAFTFAYFYPRNEILFKTAELSNVDLIRKTWEEWRVMNWVRTGILVVGLVCSCASLHKWYTISQ